MFSNETLRFINDNTFREAEPPKDRSRPLEWRRSFNTINLEARDPLVEYVYSINEVDHFARITRADGLSAEQDESIVAGAAKRRLRVTVRVAQEELRDSILCTTEKEKGTGLFELRRTKDDLIVSIKEADPGEQHGPFAKGAYPGLLYKTNFEPGQDGLSIEVGIAQEHLREIVTTINEKHVSTLHISLSLLSFSDEVDDALREWHHARELFVHGGTAPAALLSLRLASAVPTPQPTLDAEAAAQSNAKPEPAASALVVQSPFAPDYSALIKGIRNGLWVVVGILLLHLFK
jgi:hypothetical protein